MNAGRDYVLGLGSNLGSCIALLRAAIALLQTRAGCEVTALSSVLATEPIGPPQPRYRNLALRVRAPHEPDALWTQLASIEDALGRERAVRWGPRTIDIDVLWAPEPIHTEALQVPHRELERRWFALAGLLEVAPELMGQYGPTLRELAAPPPEGGTLADATRLRQHLEPGMLHIAIEAPSRADALALAVEPLAGHAPPVQVRTARIECEAGQEARALLEEVRARAGAGFAVTAAPIVSLQPGSMELRLLGGPAPPRHLPELIEAREQSTGSDTALELVFSAAAPAA